MRSKFKNIGLVAFGVVTGIAASVQFDAIAQKTADASLPLDELRQLSDVFGLIKSDYVEPVDDKKLLTDALSGMVASLDPHSAYLDKKGLQDLRESTEGKFVGLGIVVGMEDGVVKVISPIEDSPAYRAGIKAGDLIIKLDSTLVKGLTLEQAVKRMRGEPNSKITLTIARKGEDRPMIMTIQRQEIHTPSVKSKVMENGYGWLRITQFQENTVQDMVTQLQAMYKKEPNLKGLVLDLRNDPGGVLQAAVGVAGAFLPRDAVIVTANGQLPSSNQSFAAKPSVYSGNPLRDPLAALPAGLKTVPMVVLINTGSASASEIVAGALQDYKRATLMGSQSFGKGSIQTIIPLPPKQDTAVKLTTARYYTPSGRSIQAHGIIPEVMLDEYADGDNLNGLRIREADLTRHLTNDRDKTPEAKEPQLTEEEEAVRLNALAKKHKPIEYGNDDDFQLTQALNQLKGLPVKASKVVKAKDTPPSGEDSGAAKNGDKPATSKAPDAAPTATPKTDGATPSSPAKPDAVTVPPEVPANSAPTTEGPKLDPTDPKK